METMDQGIGMWDADFNLMGFNAKINRFVDMPEELLTIGTPVEAWFRYVAVRGDVDVQQAFLAKSPSDDAEVRHGALLDLYRPGDTD